MKRCNGCDTEKALDAFALDRSTKDGRQRRCKDCHRARYLAHREENIKRAAERYAADPERAHQQGRRWREAHPARAAELRRQWYAAHPEVRREANRRRRALINGSAVDSFTSDELLAHWSALGLHDCIYCGAPYEHADHVIPLSRGGAHSLDNLVPACAACNLSKGAKLLEEWLPTRQ